jgi:hypothetical protein
MYIFRAIFGFFLGSVNRNYGSYWSTEDQIEQQTMMLRSLRKIQVLVENTATSSTNHDDDDAVIAISSSTFEQVSTNREKTHFPNVIELQFYSYFLKA